MKTTILVSACLLLCVSVTRVETQGPRADPTVGPSAGAEATISKYCVTCHNQRAKIGGLVLEGLDLTAAGREPQTWEKVVRKVRTGMMPPNGAPRPDRVTLDGFAASIESTIDRAARTAPNPGAPALHRLNACPIAC